MAVKKVKQKKTSKNGQTHTRGIKVTLFLVLVSLAALNFVIAAFDYKAPHDLTFYLVTLTRILFVAGVILMWLWKRLGIFLYATAVLFVLFLPPLLAEINGLPTPHPIEYLYLLAGTAVLYGLHYLILKPKWHLFK